MQWFASPFTDDDRQTDNLRQCLVTYGQAKTHTYYLCRSDGALEKGSRELQQERRGEGEGEEEEEELEQGEAGKQPQEDTQTDSDTQTDL